MYGFIYNTLRSLVVDNYGEEAWNDVCSKAGVTTTLYLDHHYYDEAILAAVGAAASELLGVPLEDILEKFGAHFFETIKKSGHSSLLRTLGHNLYGFLVNLDSLHDHLSFTYTQMQAPSFRCEKTPSSLRLHYYSQRKGLEAIVIGIVKAVARSFFDLEVDIRMVKCEELNEKLSYHCVFDIETRERCRTEKCMERLRGSRTEMMVDEATPTVPEEPYIIEMDDQQFEDEASALPPLPTISRRGSCMLGAHPSDWPVTAQIFQSCFPFHIILDKDLVVRHMGISLMRLFPQAIATEARINDYFELARPPVDLTYANIRSYVHNVFLLNIKGRYLRRKKTLQFRGEMVPLSVHDPNSAILFLSSPRISSVEELELQGLYISDIPIHDVTRDLILLNRHFRVEMNIAEQLEKTKHDLEIQKAIVQEEKARADRLLHAMLPPSIARELTSGAQASATEYSSVTILFSDIKGFTTICSECAPMCVVGMLNNLYTRFDSLIEKHSVYKVETIGDAYMVAAGLLDTSVNHAEAVANMAFGMRDAAKYVVKPATEEPLQIRIGIHSGPVVAGVVGLKMPRYCLFGDTVNTASRMESHGEADRVHISDITYQMLKGKPFVFSGRGKIGIKGLGMRETYFMEPASSCGGDMLVIDQSLQRGLYIGRQTGVSRNTSFVVCSQNVPHNEESLSNIDEEKILKSELAKTDQSKCLAQPAISTEGDSIVIRVPTADEPKRCEEEEEEEEEDMLVSSSVPSAKDTTKDLWIQSPKGAQLMSQVFGFLLLCFPLALGLLLTVPKGS